jgi:hypothetical protein
MTWRANSVRPYHVLARRQVVALAQLHQYAPHLIVTAQVEIESKIEAKFHHISVSSA